MLDWKLVDLLQLPLLQYHVVPVSLLYQCN
jgi:hypothetical protein